MFKFSTGILLLAICVTFIAADDTGAETTTEAAGDTTVVSEELLTNLTTALASVTTALGEVEELPASENNTIRNSSLTRGVAALTNLNTAATALQTQLTEINTQLTQNIDDRVTELLDGLKEWQTEQVTKVDVATGGYSRRDANSRTAVVIAKYKAQLSRYETQFAQTNTIFQRQLKKAIDGIETSSTTLATDMKACASLSPAMCQYKVSTAISGIQTTINNLKSATSQGAQLLASALKSNTQITAIEAKYATDKAACEAQLQRIIDQNSYRATTTTTAGSTDDTTAESTT